MIIPGTEISVKRQCELVGISRSGWYSGNCVRNNCEDFDLMRNIDRIYTRFPFYGSRRIVEALRREGQNFNRKKIQRLMRTMGIAGQSPGIMTSKQHPEHRKFPYLLNGLDIVRPNLVWCADITYIPMSQGYVYLVAVMDWYSRSVMSWEISNTLDNDFCVKALRAAVTDYGVPDIFNTDQGCQFTSAAFIGELESCKIRISMDGKGRVFDNIFIERLWRSLKYEDIYMKDYTSVLELYRGLENYFRFYNEERPHQALEYKTPMEVYQRVAA